MQTTKAEINHSIARTLGEPHSPYPADYIGDEENSDRFIAWARPQIDIQALSAEMQWVYNYVKSGQGEAVALHWAIVVMGLAQEK